MSAERRRKSKETSNDLSSLVSKCVEGLQASDAVDVWDSLEPLAKVRKSLKPADKALVKSHSARFFAPADASLKSSGWDESALCSIRALVFLILGDEEQERLNLERCLKLSLNQADLALLFERLETTHLDLIESYRTPDSEKLHEPNLMRYAPVMAEPEHTKDKPTSHQNDGIIDLGRAFFSQGPEVAEAHLIRLAAEMGARFPKRKEALKSKVVEAIDGGSGKASSAKRAKDDKPGEAKEVTAATLKEVKLPPRTGHPLIEKFASLWDQRKSLARQDFVQRFQELLDDFHNSKNLGDPAYNTTTVRWINHISSKSKIDMYYGDDAVRVRFVDKGQGYFDLREAAGKAPTIKGTGATSFHKLATRSRTGRTPS